MNTESKINIKNENSNMILKFLIYYNFNNIGYRK